MTLDSQVDPKSRVDAPRVAFVDLGRENRALCTELLAAADRVLQSGRYLYGAELEAFEAELATYLGAPYAVGVASGTDAVELALRACGVGPGDRVAVTAFTAVPTVNAIEAAGGEPVLCDVSERGANAFTAAPWAKAALSVSLYGYPSEDDGCYEQPLVEDLAHALGCGRPGETTTAAAISFYPTKCLGTLGDGGAVVTRHAEIAERVRHLRHYGFDGDNVRWRGQNSRLCEMQAAFLRVKLGHLNAWNARRREIAQRYTEALPSLCLPYDERATYHVFPIRHPARTWLRNELTARGIDTMVHYPRAIHQHDRWRHLGVPGQFPNAEKWAAEEISLPCYPYLTDSEQTAVIEAVKECAK